MENPNIQFLLSQLRATFDRQPWYGDSVMKKLREVPHEAVMAVPQGLANSVAKLVRHMIVWREYALAKIGGDAALTIVLSTPEDWPPVSVQTAQDWDALLQRLVQSQTDLLDALASKTDAWLLTPVPGKPQEPFRELLEGIIHHDLYHLGQIVLVAKLTN